MNLGVPDLLAITFKVLRIEFHSPVVALVQPYVLSPYNTIRTSSWLPSSLSNQHMTSSVAYLQKKLPTTGKKGNACGECFGTGERFGRSVGAKWMDQPTFFLLEQRNLFDIHQSSHAIVVPKRSALHSLVTASSSLRRFTRFLPLLLDTQSRPTCSRASKHSSATCTSRDDQNTQIKPVAKTLFPIQPTLEGSQRLNI